MTDDVSPMSASGLHHVEMVMGMAVSIDVQDADPGPDAVDAVVAWLHHVDDTFSTYKDESPISALGRGDIGLDDVSEEIRDVLRDCEELHQLTDGFFDAFEVPAPNGTRFDPSGYVKGWSIERAAEILESHGCRNFCINAGGDIALRGVPHGAAEWRVGIRHPFDDEALAVVVEGAGRLSIATSALYERGRHIVDPRNGEAAVNLASVTIVGPDLGRADGFATAVFVMGLDGLRWIEQQPGYEAYLITNDGMTFWSPGFRTYRVYE